MIKLGIRQRVLVTFASIVLCGGLALFLSAGLELRQATLDFFQYDLQTSALNLANSLAEGMEEYADEERTDAGYIQTLLEYAPVTPGQSFTALDTHRRVIASTASPRYAIYEQLPNTPELQSALNGQLSHIIRNSETGEERMYIAVPVLYEQEILGVLHTSAPMEKAYDDVREKWYGLAVVAIPILLLTVGASLWLGQTLTKPIKQLHATALRVADGALSERVSVTNDDEIGQLGRAFNYMADRLNALLTAQRNFVSNAAHELRTPLMGIKLRVEALQDSTLPDNRRATYFSELKNEVDHMSGLIAQLLILARLDEGRHEMDQPPDDPVAFLQDMARTWRIRAQAAGINFYAEVPENLPVIPVATSDLQIILDNLLENAMKYTPPDGSVWLCAGQKNNMLHLLIKDTGEGFQPEESQTLFERFYRINRQRDQDIPGTGLGLAIVKAVLERYKGTVTATSDGPNQGAAFEVTFSLAE
jgi:signal transduction histidine kinase